MVKKFSWGKFETDLNPPKQYSEVVPTIPIHYGRVTDICLDENSPLYIDGSYSNIGSISFDFVETSINSSNLAKPLNPFLKTYPLINEIVVILEAPDDDAQSRPESKSYYYLSVTNIWNNPEFNALPNTIQNQLNRNREEIEGLSNELDPNGSSGGNFIETGNTKNLKSFPGDIIMQGRTGNSIRLGSTQFLNDNSLPNTYSSNKLTGNPILILRNGQTISENIQNPRANFFDTVENINLDPSSFYLTTNQIIPLRSLAFNTDNYITNAPTSLNAFENPQAIISSDRIVFSAKKDSIILDADKSVSINSNGSLNLSTSVTIVDSSIILLGNKKANSPVVKGDQLILLLGNLIEAVENFSDAFITKTLTEGGTIGEIVEAPEVAGVKIGRDVVKSSSDLENQALALQSICRKIKKEGLSTLNSKTVKTI
tara:strand:+ start:461 stop:1744 length:1284 start_codon:yes stop_codon:yes gene_type:complete